MVHLDFNVSSWPWFGQKPIVRVKTSRAKELDNFVMFEYHKVQDHMVAINRICVTCFQCSYK